MSEFVMNNNRNDGSYALASEAEGDRVYTISGRHDRKEGEYYVLDITVEEARENPYAHAMKSNNAYYVKVAENGKLFNPYGMYSEGMERKQRVGRPTWKFRSTNKQIFNNYVRFLGTKNETFLRNAEREMI